MENLLYSKFAVLLVEVQTRAFVLLQWEENVITGSASGRTAKFKAGEISEMDKTSVN